MWRSEGRFLETFLEAFLMEEILYETWVERI